MSDKIRCTIRDHAKLLLWAGKQFTKTKFCYYLNPMKSLCNLARLSLAAGQGVPPLTVCGTQGGGGRSKPEFSLSALN